MQEFFINEAVIYTLVVLGVVLLAFLLRLAAKYYANNKLSLLMLAVEKKLSTWAKEQSASGEEKRQATITLISLKLYPMIPAWAKLFISEESLKKQVDKLYCQMIDYLDDGETNNSFPPTAPPPASPVTE